LAQDCPLFTSLGSHLMTLLRSRCGRYPLPHPLFKVWFVVISFRGSPEFEGLASQAAALDTR